MKWDGYLDVIRLLHKSSSNKNNLSNFDGRIEEVKKQF